MHFGNTKTNLFRHYAEIRSEYFDVTICTCVFQSIPINIQVSSQNKVVSRDQKIQRGLLNNFHKI